MFLGAPQGNSKARDTVLLAKVRKSRPQELRVSSDKRGLILWKLSPGDGVTAAKATQVLD